MSRVYLTEAKYKQLLKELEKLKKIDRREVSKEIGTARDKGDLRENAEYDAAREKQAFIEKRIAELEDKLSRVQLTDDLNIDTGVVNIGARVSIEDVVSGEKITYHLVGPDEADYSENKISVTSPVGSGLLGAKKNDIRKISVPAGVIEYKILSFKYD